MNYYTKKETDKCLVNRTLKVVKALDTLSKLKADNWHKDIKTIDKCEKLIKVKTKDVFKNLKTNDYIL